MTVLADLDELHNLSATGQLRSQGEGGAQVGGSTVNDYVQGAADALSDIPKFVVSSLTSGGVGVYNTGVAVANAFGADAEEADTAALLASYDDDLSKYYTEHKAGADIMGFIATSFVPGMVGVKVLHGAQAGINAAKVANAGRLGRLGQAVTGILAPPVEAYSFAARARVATGLSQAEALSWSTIRAVGTQGWQAALEAGAFEMAAVATQFNGEVLKEKDARDLVGDMALNMALGGVLGGAFGAIGQYYRGKRAAEAVDRTVSSLFPKTEYVGISEGTRAVDYLRRISEVPPEFTARDVLLGRIPGLKAQFPAVDDVANASTAQLEAASALADRLNLERGKQIRELHNGVRGSITKLTPNDGGLASDVLDNLLVHGSDGGFMLNSTRLSRLGGVRMTKAMKEAGGDVTYMVLHGDEAGSILSTGASPNKWRLADLYQDGDAMLKAARKLPFNKLAPKDGADFSAVGKYTELDADARYMLMEKATPENYRFDKIAHSRFDIPALKAAVRNKTPILVKDVDGAEVLLSPGEALSRVQISIDAILENTAKAAMRGEKVPSAGALAHRLDVPVSYVEGNRTGDVYKDYFGNLEASRVQSEKLRAVGQLGAGSPNVDVRRMPKYLAIHTARELGEDFVRDSTGFAIDNMATVAGRIKQAQLIQAKNSGIAMQDYKDVWATLPEGGLQADKATRYSGSGLVVSAGTSLWGPKALTEFVGKQVQRMQQLATERLIKEAAPHFAPLEANPLVATRFNALNNLMQRAGEPHMLVELPEVGMHLVPSSLVRRTLAQNELEDISQLTAKMLDDVAESGAWQPKRAGAKPRIEVREDVLPVVQTHMQETKKYALQQHHIERARGIDGADRWLQRAEEFYPLPPNPNQYKYYAFVVDSTIGGRANGGTTMIHAASESQLRELMARVPTEKGFKVYTGPEAERYYQSMGKYDYERTLHDARVNTELERSGVSADFFAPTDGKELSGRLMEFHVGRAHGNIRAAVEARYADDFETLRNIGQEYTDLARSKKGAFSEKAARGTVQNPYEDLIKTALNINKFSEYGWWHGLDQTVNSVAAQAMSRIGTAMRGVKAPEDLAGIKAVLDEYGLGKGYEDASAFVHAGHAAGGQPVTKFVQSMNSLVATFALRLDALNSVVNSIGGALTRSSELRFLMNALERAKKGDVAAADTLGPLAKLKVEDVSIFSPLKAQSRAFEALAGMGKDHPWYKEFVAKGYITEDVALQHQLLDMAAVRPGDTAGSLLARAKEATALWTKATNAGAKWTGNQLAESSNRFVSAYVAKELTELGVAQNLISRGEQDAIINAFVNRAEGTLVSSQKPILFNGSIGGALGLFQSYQFRLMQQMFRFVGEGTKKDVAYMLGLQGTLFGANSLPGFAAINEHIIGRYSSNPERRDLYDAMYSGAGRHGGDLLLYGIPSNLLQNNLYTRGDVNPRHPLIVPTSLSEAPAYGMTEKFLTAAAGFVRNSAETGNIGHSLLTAFEQNGVSRPLAGISMLAKAAAYQDGKVVLRSGKNTDLVTSELWDLMQVTRLAGGKPLTEAVVMDEFYRRQAISRRDTEKRAELAQTLRLELQAGTLSQESMDKYVDSFVRTGKKQEEFAKWSMSVVKQATDEQKGTITSMLKTPYGRTMQIIMGGRETATGNI